MTEICQLLNLYPVPFNTPPLTVEVTPEIKFFGPSLILHPKGAGFILFDLKNHLNLYY